jgi:hypothetical protein
MFKNNTGRYCWHHCPATCVFISSCNTLIFSLVIRYCLMYCLFIYTYLFSITVARRRRLWESSEALLLRPWAAASGRARQVIFDHIDHMCFLSLVYTLVCLLQYCYLSLIVRIWIHNWLVMLSHAIMSVVQVLPSFVMLSLPCVFDRDSLPSIKMWSDHDKNRCYGLSNGWNGGDG